MRVGAHAVVGQRRAGVAGVKSVVVHKEEVMKDIKCWHCGKIWDNPPMTRPLMTDQDRALDFALQATHAIKQRNALAVVVKELAAAAKAGGDLSRQG